MVTIYNEHALSEYLKNDFILKSLKEYPADAGFISHKWLVDMPEKRMIYADVYGALIGDSGKKVLDVGGGFCGLSRELIEKHDYTLLDIMAHDEHSKLDEISSDNGDFWVDSDWYEFEPKEKYDVVVANDLFPNVDQRLRLFIEKFKDYTSNFIFTVTCNDKDVFYKVKRVDADEIMAMAPWTRGMAEGVLKEVLKDDSIELPLDTDKEPIFRNGRVVYKVSHTVK